jgi:hypothetical protein
MKNFLRLLANAHEKSAVDTKLFLLFLYQIVLCACNTGHFDTHFSSGYSSIGFESIQPGMSKEEVIDAIGRPLHASVGAAVDGKSGDPKVSEYWMYSEQGKDKRADYYERIVAFNRSGKVYRTEKRIYRD